MYSAIYQRPLCFLQNYPLISIQIKRWSRLILVEIRSNAHGKSFTKIRSLSLKNQIGYRICWKLTQKWFKKFEVPFILEPSDTCSNYWLNAVLLADAEERDSFLEYTNGHGVMTRPMWTPMHTLPMYQNCTKGDLTISESIESRLVNIPSSVI